MLGIAIITYNRLAKARCAISHIEANTAQPYELVVCDDGSSDGSAESLRELGYTVVSGRNTGVCWNKNRAIFYLTQIKKCSSIILIEDDSWPAARGWERDWVEAIRYYGHVNLAGSWFADSCIAGTGSPSDPFFSASISGQCCGFSAEALSYVGYLDTRFRGYGYGHVEHSQRMIKAGFGGVSAVEEGLVVPRYILIESPITVTADSTFKNDEQLAHNSQLFTDLQHEPIFRAPWRSDQEMAQFRSEIRTATMQAATRFDEAFYLSRYPDVAEAVNRGECDSGEVHYRCFGQFEHRLPRFLNG